MIGITGGEDLRFCLEAAKGARMNDAVAVARVIATIRMGGFRIPPAARVLRPHRPGNKNWKLIDGPLRICGQGRTEFSSVEIQDFAEIQSRPRSACSASGVSGNSFFTCR